MRKRKFSLYRDKDIKEVSNWKILIYSFPSICISLILTANIVINPYFVFWVTILVFWWLVPIIILSSVVAFFSSLRNKGILKQTVLRLSLINLILFLFLMFVKMPIYGCDPVKMAKHYDRKAEQFEELVTYAYSSSTTQESGRLKTLLRRTGCRSIDTSDPDYCDIEYKRPWADAYRYRIYLRPMTPDEYDTYLEKSEFIPHNDRVVMMFGGGVTSRLGFSDAECLEYYRKYPPTESPDKEESRRKTR